MNTDTQNLEHLRRLIRLELSRCDNKLWPEICKLQSTKAGYQRIESEVIRLALDEGMPVGSAIAQMEQEFSHSQPPQL